MASCVKTTSTACDTIKTSQEKDRYPKNQVKCGQGDLKETEKVVESLKLGTLCSHVTKENSINYIDGGAIQRMEFSININT